MLILQKFPSDDHVNKSIKNRIHRKNNKFNNVILIKMMKSDNLYQKF